MFFFLTFTKKYAFVIAFRLFLQHAKYTTPDYRHGYCVDDNARALIVACTYYDLRKDKEIIPLAQRYLSFMFYNIFADMAEESLFRKGIAAGFAIGSLVKCGILLKQTNEKDQ